MSVPNIHGLRRENWSSYILTNLSSLQNMEIELAKQENRESCVLKVLHHADNRNGLYTPGELESDGKNSIYINPGLLTADTPYKATETLFHEARHAYQYHIVKNPELSKEEDQPYDWRINGSQAGYLDHKTYGYNLYRWQPIEKDANEIARDRTNQFYEQNCNDVKYQTYRQEREKQIINNKIEAEKQLGPNYIEVAKNRSYYQYNQVMTQSRIQNQITNQELSHLKSTEKQIQYHEINQNKEVQSEEIPLEISEDNEIDENYQYDYDF